jgi:hypothetical protein
MELPKEEKNAMRQESEDFCLCPLEGISDVIGKK